MNLRSKNRTRLRLLNALVFLVFCNLYYTTNAQKTVRYDLVVRDTSVAFAGVMKHAISVNGQIPMPTLYFTQGDTAEIVVHNKLKQSTSLHWHGLFLPNEFDGVPNVTQMPIEPDSTFVYRFPIIQSGTHWYHSHSGLQEQIGMYGMFIMSKKESDSTFRANIDDIPSINLILSEWTNLKPENVHRMLHNATDWFAIKKGSTQSYAEAIQQGYFRTKVGNEWKRMTAMDVSDVYYDKVLFNGNSDLEYNKFKAGDRVRLRIANGGASSYFWLNFAGGKMTVVANDGNDVEPIEVDRLLIAVSETYDVIVTLPQDSISYEFRATSEDRTQNTSVWIGNGKKKLASPLDRLKYFEGMKMMNSMMNMDGSLDDMGMNMSLNQMDMNIVMYPEITGSLDMRKNAIDTTQDYRSNEQSDITTLNYSMLRAPYTTELPVDSTLTLRFELSGNMNRYVWSMNNKVVSESDKILIKKGQNVKMIIYNGSMMRHPMHLHGHDFRLLNGQGSNAPLKNIVDIMPMETDTLEFNANIEGDWFFHCHILYHMMSGMGRIFTYENQSKNPKLTNPKLANRNLMWEDRKPHFMIHNGFESNGNDGEAMLTSTRWTLSTEWRLGYHAMHGYEIETHLGRHFGKMQWFMPFIGYDWRYRTRGINFQEENIFGQSDTKDTRKSFSLGLQYTLPMLVKLEMEYFTNGTFLVQLKREDIPISKRLRSSFIVNSDKEYMIGMRYIMTRSISVSTHYDSDMGWGAGITVMY
jgi:FtsP/CotA-like multicopper oxidase with cupredoxin domain